MGVLDTIAKAGPALSAIQGISSGIANYLGGREMGRATERAAGITQEQLDQIRADAAPFREAGLTALTRLLEENIGPLEETPDFQFIRDEGIRALDRSASARGKTFSGEALRDLARFGSGLASRHAGDRRQTLASIAGFGPGAVSTTSGAGLASGGQLAQLALGQGAANASSFAAPVNAFNQTTSDLISQAAMRGLFR